MLRERPARWISCSWYALLLLHWPGIADLLTNCERISRTRTNVRRAQLLDYSPNPTSVSSPSLPCVHHSFFCLLWPTFSKAHVSKLEEERKGHLQKLNEQEERLQKMHSRTQELEERLQASENEKIALQQKLEQLQVCLSLFQYSLRPMLTR